MLPACCSCGADLVAHVAVASRRYNQFGPEYVRQAGWKTLDRGLHGRSFVLRSV